MTGDFPQHQEQLRDPLMNAKRESEPSPEKVIQVSEMIWRRSIRGISGWKHPRRISARTSPGGSGR